MQAANGTAFMCMPHGDTRVLLAVVSGGRSVNVLQDVGLAGPLCAALLHALCMHIGSLRRWEGGASMG